SPSTPSYPPGTAGVPLASPPYPPPRMRGEGRAGARRPRSQGVGEGGGAYSTLPAKRIWFFPFPHGREKGGGPASSVLFRNGRHLDGVSIRHQGETQASSSCIEARRDAIKVKCKPAPTRGRPGNRLWQRQRPVGGRSLSEQVEQGRRRRRDFYDNPRVGA